MTVLSLPSLEGSHRERALIKSGQTTRSIGGCDFRSGQFDPVNDGFCSGALPLPMPPDQGSTVRRLLNFHSRSRALRPRYRPGFAVGPFFDMRSGLRFETFFRKQALSGALFTAYFPSKMNFSKHLSFGSAHSEITLYSRRLSELSVAR